MNIIQREKLFIGSKFTKIIYGHNIFSINQETLSYFEGLSNNSSIFILTDKRIAQLYGKKILRIVKSINKKTHILIVPEGEASKTIKNYIITSNQIINLGANKNSVIISLGGGAICNVSGFIASTLFRGVKFIQIPTTLMAQVDVALSNKQAINVGQGKNFLGSLYTPELIIIDSYFLQTLDLRDLRNGVSECIKHALGQDSKYLTYLYNHSSKIRDPDFHQYVISKNIQLKSYLLHKDSQENKIGCLLQYGHIIGHALEIISSYRIFHGESISVGMMISSKLSVILGIATYDLVDTHQAILMKYKLPTILHKSIDLKYMLHIIKFNNKHNIKLSMPLLKEIGKLNIVNDTYYTMITENVLINALKAFKKV